MSEARAAGGLYHGVLASVERAIVVALLAAVIGLSAAEILVRVLDLQLFDRVTAQIASYYLAFHLGMFSAVLACREARHIAIDAVTPHLRARWRRAVQATLLGVAAVTCGALAVVAWRYVFDFVAADDTIVPGLAPGLWSERVWKAPIILALAWMALHFVVTAVEAGRGRLHLGHLDVPVPEDDAPADDAPGEARP